MRRVKLALAVAALSSMGCYRTVIESGRPGDGVERKAGGLSFIYGLTPVQVTTGCPSGVARAETYFAWYNLLLLPITGGLLTGLETRYECARADGAR